MDRIEKQIGYKFKDIENLKKALTHSSFVKERELPRWLCNERLEFLGDGILDAVICHTLYNKFPKDEEGKMARLKSDIVRRGTLASIAESLDIGKHLILGNGEKMYGGSNKENILADALEAIIGAIFLESGFDVTQRIIHKIFENKLEKAYKGKLDENYKSNFQEIIHKTGKTNIKYVLVKETGMSHDKTFFVNLLVDDILFGQGQGKSKKKAENEAAKRGIEYINSLK